MKRKYYAQYSRYGVKTCWANSGKLTGDFYAFESKKARDSWVEAHEWDSYPNWTARAVTRRQVVSQLGVSFYPVNYEAYNFDGGLACYRWRDIEEEGLLNYVEWGDKI